MTAAGSGAFTTAVPDTIMLAPAWKENSNILNTFALFFCGKSSCLCDLLDRRRPHSSVHLDVKVGVALAKEAHLKEIRKGSFH